MAILTLTLRLNDAKGFPIALSANRRSTGAMDERMTIAELERRLAETCYCQPTDSWAQAVWETDATGVVVSDSPSWRAFTGQTLDQWLGYGWLDAIHPDDQAYAERQWREAVAARTRVDTRFRLHAADGDWRWTNVRAAPVLDAQGNVEKWAGMNFDIDARPVATGDEEKVSASIWRRFRAGFRRIFGRSYYCGETRIVEFSRADIYIGFMQKCRRQSIFMAL